MIFYCFSSSSCPLEPLPSLSYNMVKSIRHSDGGSRCRFSAGGLLALCHLASVGWCLASDRSFVSSVVQEKILAQSVTEEAPSLNVLVVGDWGRKGLYNQSAVAEQMGQVGAELNIEFVISTGDNFYENGLTGVDDAAFNESFSQIYTAESLQKTWHNVLGNHDYRGDALAQLDPQLRLLDPRWHCERSFLVKHELGSPCEGEASSVEFFFYDSNPFVEEYWQSSEHHYDWRGVEPRQDYLTKQKLFLNNSLQASDATWKIVVGHHPIRTVGHHGDTVELKDQIYPILKANGVHLYVNGHDHCLEHISADDSEIQFLTSGGGSKAWRGMNENANKSGLQFYYDGQGFMSLTISHKNLTANFYDALGNILHTMALISFQGAA